MKAGERVVRSVPDRSGRVYARMDQGGQRRMVALVAYMDERQTTQLHTLERGSIVEIDRHQAQDAVLASDATYVQHVVITTDLQAGELYYDDADVAERVGRAIQDQRPDAEIYAIAIHGDGVRGERHLHVHLAIGTQTTLRHGDLERFREQAADLSEALKQKNGLQSLERQQVQIRQHQQEREQGQEQ